jgi:hypothetical protein
MGKRDNKVLKADDGRIVDSVQKASGGLEDLESDRVFEAHREYVFAEVGFGIQDQGFAPEAAC